MELITNAARAAQSAAEAARTMKEASEAKNRSNFSEASKVVKCPEFFGYPTSDEDQNCWRDFAFSFKAWSQTVVLRLNSNRLRRLQILFLAFQPMRRLCKEPTSCMQF